MDAAAHAAIWIGVDVAKETVTAAVAAGDIRSHAEFATGSFPRTAEGAGELLQWARAAAGDAPLRAVLEATGRYSLEFAGWLLAADAACGPAIVDPRLTCHFAKSLGMRNKTDPDDARALARFGAERHPVPHEPPAGVYATLRERTRARQALVEQRTALEAACGENADPFSREAMNRVITALSAEIASLDKAVAALCSEDPGLARDTRLLDTVYGVGLLTAATILAELGDLRRFRRRGQLAAFAGLTPRRRESGTSVRGRTPITKCGTARVRRILYTAAMTAVRGDNHLADKYKALTGRKLAGRAALVAIARTMLLEMRSMLIHGEKWRPKNVAHEKTA